MISERITTVLEFVREQIVGMVGDTGKSKITDIKKDIELRRQMEALGEFICMHVEAGCQDELAEKIQSIFSKDEIDRVYEKIKDQPGFVWAQELNGQLKSLCTIYEIKGKDAESFIQNFLNMVFLIVCQDNSEMANQMFWGNMYRSMQDNFAEIRKGNDETQRLILLLPSLIKSFIRQPIKNPEKENEEYLKGNESDNPQSLSESVNEATNHPAAVSQESAREQTEYERDAEVDWQLHYEHKDGLLGNQEKRQNDIRTLTIQWREEREHYPNWYIPPASIREKLELYNQCEGLLQCETLVSLKEQFDFTYELLWRYETALLPYTKFLQQQAYRIWKTVDEKEWLSNNDTKDRWFQIGLFLLREFREDLQEKDWNEVYRHLAGCIKSDKEKEFLLTWERILMNFSKMEISCVCNQLESLAVDPSFWEIRLRLCGLKAECGMRKEAQKELNALSCEVRNKIFCEKPKKQPERIYFKSLYACILHLQGFLLQSTGDYDETTRAEILNYHRERKKWFSFHSFEKEKAVCDHAVFTWMEKRYDLPSFELNRETVKIMDSGNYCREAYSFYRLLEKSGLPLHLGRVRLLSSHRESMMEAILDSHPRVAWQLLLRSEEKKDVERCLTRKRLALWDREAKDELFRYVYNALDRNIDLIKNHNPWWDGNICTSIADAAVEILKCMSAVATLPQQDQLIHLMINLIEKDAIQKVRSLDPFIIRVMGAASETSKASALNALLDCSAQDRHRLDSDKQVDPFDVISSKKLAEPLYKKNYVDPVNIINIFKKAEGSDTERSAAISRLGKLYQWGKLSVDQQRLFGELLWKQAEETTGLPDTDNYYVFVYLQWPCPSNIDVKDRIKNYFFAKKKIQDLHESLQNYKLFEIPYLDQLRVFNENIQEFWTADEMEQLMTILLGFWEDAKAQMDARDGYFPEWEEKYLYRAYRLLVRTMASFSKTDSGLLSPLAISRTGDTLKSMREYGIETGEAEVVFSAGKEREGLLERLVDSLYATDTETAVPAAFAIQKYMLEYAKENEEKQTFLFLELLKVIRAGKEPDLAVFLVIVHNIFYQNKKRLPEEILCMVNKALIAVEQKTRYTTEKQTDWELKRNIEIRAQGAALAFQVYRYEEEYQNKKEHSIATIQWKEICCEEKSVEEFVEVKNAWII